MYINEGILGIIFDKNYLKYRKDKTTYTKKDKMDVANYLL